MTANAERITERKSQQKQGKQKNKQIKQGRSSEWMKDAKGFRN